MYEGLLTLEEARRYLGGISISTMRRLIGEGKIAHVRVGRRILRFRPIDLDRYVLNGLIEPSQDKKGNT